MYLQEVIDLELQKPMDYSVIMKLSQRKGLKYLYYDELHVEGKASATRWNQKNLTLSQAYNLYAALAPKTEGGKFWLFEWAAWDFPCVSEAAFVFWTLDNIQWYIGSINGRICSDPCFGNNCLN